MAPDAAGDDVGQLLTDVHLPVGLRGYDCKEVDAFLEKLRAASTDTAAGLDFGDEGARSLSAPTAQDVRRKEFRLSLRGYGTDATDAFLERVARALDQTGD